MTRIRLPSVMVHKPHQAPHPYHALSVNEEFDFLQQQPLQHQHQHHPHGQSQPQAHVQQQEKAGGALGTIKEEDTEENEEVNLKE
jgi:hypothetical protein